MTEREWLSSTEPQAMLTHLHLRGGVSSRKWRLYAVASCRQNFCRLLKGSQRWEAIEAVLSTALRHVERHADGQMDYETLRDVLQSLRKASPDLAEKTCVFPEWLNRSALRSPYEAACAMDWPLTRKSHADLLRCLFGNPFRPTVLEPDWLTRHDGKVLQLAQAFYDMGALDRLPELADALEEAGCHDTEILAHCRQPGPHVRGCWAVDLVLGSSLGEPAA